MFRGATSISIDSKGRIAIPTRYRAELWNIITEHWFVP